MINERDRAIHLTRIGIARILDIPVAAVWPDRQTRPTAELKG